MAQPHDPSAPVRPIDALPAPRGIAQIAVGGAAGALARVGVGAALPGVDTGWPWGTLAANLTGALLLGLLLARLHHAARPPSWVKPMLGTGVLGGYTTFSTLSVEVVELLRDAPAAGIAYAVVSVVAGLAAVYAGTRLGGAGAAEVLGLDAP